MVLSMTRPWPHPKTGVYWFRKAVPAALRPLLKKRQLRTDVHRVASDINMLWNTFGSLQCDMYDAQRRWSATLDSARA